MLVMAGSRREGYREQARSCREWMDLAAADGNDQLQPVAIVQGGFGVLALGNDLAVHFDGKAFANQFKLLGQGRDGKRGREFTAFAIDEKLDHGRARVGLSKRNILTRDAGAIWRRP